MKRPYPNYNPVHNCENCKIRVFGGNCTQLKRNGKWIRLCDKCYNQDKKEQQDV